MKIKHNHNGFTIIELLLALAFFSFMLILMTASFIQINRSYVRGNNISEAQQQARAIFDEVISVIGLAKFSEVQWQDNDDAEGPHNEIADFLAGGETDIDACNINYNDTSRDIDLNDDSDETAIACRHRICVGGTVFAWNQSVKSSDYSETSRVYINPPGFWEDHNAVTRSREPFEFVKVIGQTDCLGRIDFSKATELIDGNRFTIQDFDIWPDETVVTEGVNTSFKLSITLSTVDNDPNDNEDLDFSFDAGPLSFFGLTVDNSFDNSIVPSGPVVRPATTPTGTGVTEYKGRRCHTDQGSQEFCYITNLRTTVTTRQ